MNIEQLLTEDFSEKDIKRELVLPKEYRAGGFIYVLSNESLQGIFKVGFTRRNVMSRVLELSRSTSIPTPFNIEGLFHSVDPAQDEKTIHHLLKDTQVSANREFFKAPLQEILNVCREVTQFSADDDLSVIAVTNDVVALNAPDGDVDVLDVLPSVIGNERGIRNLLMEIGGTVLLNILQKHNAKLVIMPNDALELVRSIEDQHFEEKSK